MPLSVVSIGVALGQNMEIGVVYNPFNNELFYARRGQGICTIAMLMNRGEKRLLSSLSECVCSPVCLSESERLFFACSTCPHRLS